MSQGKPMFEPALRTSSWVVIWRMPQRPEAWVPQPATWLITVWTHREDGSTPLVDPGLSLGYFLIKDFSARLPTVLSNQPKDLYPSMVFVRADMVTICARYCLRPKVELSLHPYVRGTIVGI